MRPLPMLAFTLVLAANLSARAQDPQPPASPAPQTHEGREGRDDLKALGLTEDQKQKLRAIREQYPNDPKARRKAAAEVLTPEQRDKLKELRRRRREEGRESQREETPTPQP